MPSSPEKLVLSLGTGVENLCSAQFYAYQSFIRLDSENINGKLSI